jgi:hypothetical protein
VKDQDLHRLPKLIVFPAMNEKQLYRMRSAASGREAIAHSEPGSVYVDRETGEEMEPVGMVLPLAPSASSLPRSPENLRACRRCDQLIGLDVSDCPYCGLRQEAL